MRVLTIGTWSIPHAGHAAFLSRCAQLGELIVGVNSDAFVLSYRGEPALFSQSERIEIIKSLGYQAMLNDGPGRDLVSATRPDFLVVGTDWARRDYYAQIGMTQNDLDRMGIALVYLPMRPAGISASEIVRRLQ